MDKPTTNPDWGTTDLWPNQKPFPQSLMQTASPWNAGVGRWVSFWGPGLLTGAMFVLGRVVIHQNFWDYHELEYHTWIYKPNFVHKVTLPRNDIYSATRKFIIPGKPYINNQGPFFHCSGWDTWNLNKNDRILHVNWCRISEPSEWWSNHCSVVD